VRRVDQKLTRIDGSGAAYSGGHDYNLSRVALDEAHHDAIIAVVVCGLLLRCAVSFKNR
jgi:hypothetical protein